jgi:hypothetical protein
MTVSGAAHPDPAQLFAASLISALFKSNHLLGIFAKFMKRRYKITIQDSGRYRTLSVVTLKPKPEGRRSRLRGNDGINSA